MNSFIGKRKYFLMVSLLFFSFLMMASVQPAKPSCPAAVQKGEVAIRIPAGEMSGMTEVRITRCSGMNLQATAGMMLQVPLLVNGVVHHDSLILTVYLLEQQPGPVDVTVWWRVD